MSQFTKPLRIEQDADDPLFWWSLAAFEFHVGHLGSGEVIRIPAGRRSDFQSIPRIMWSVFGHPVDEYAASGFGHDEVYQYPANGVDEPRSRRRCDQIYLEMNVVLGCPWWKRTGKYTGVRVGGWVGWRKYRKKEKEARRIAEKCKEYHNQGE
jgi:hypothetical protein